MCFVGVKLKLETIYKCSFTKRNWEVVLSKCPMRRQVGDQCYELDCTVRKLNGEKLQRTICKLAWSAVIYHMWLDRNARIHNGIVWSEVDLEQSFFAEWLAWSENVRLFKIAIFIIYGDYLSLVFSFNEISHKKIKK